MNGLLALQQFLSNRFMAGPAFPQNRPRHRDGLFRVVRSLADTPLIPLAKVARDEVSRPSVESRYPSRVPRVNVRACQHLGLLANGIAGCQALEAANDAPLAPHKTRSRYYLQRSSIPASASRSPGAPNLRPS